MTTSAAPGRRILVRDTDNAVIAGVAAGLAGHFGLADRGSRWLFRLAFVALCMSAGFGLLLYGTFWIVLPPARGHPSGHRPGWLRYGVGALTLTVVVGVLWATVSPSRFSIPVLLGMLGAALIWRQAGETERERWLRVSRNSLRSPLGNRIGIGRLGAGVLMVVVGLVIVIAPGGGIKQLGEAFVAVVIVAAGFALISGPWWVRMVSELSAQRRERIRAAEREELAAHLHDSVLQTLALIQRNASSPREVARLARGQERELRTLLYGRRGNTGSLAEALQAAVAEVEDDYAVTVDAVVVGDAPLDDDLAALAQATREALINAGKHAGVSALSLYAEVEDDAVAVYVRDRGTGFEVDAIADDRRGVRGSIHDRMERHHGTATIRSQAGAGTEVSLTMRRTT